jgi:hypothetical protein
MNRYFDLLSRLSKNYILSDFLKDKLYLRLYFEKTKITMIAKRDYLWKAAFRMFMPEFIQFFYPDKYDEIDWDRKVEFLDKELHKLYLKSKHKNRVADVLARLYLKDGGVLWILLHIEVQGYFDAFFSLRLHQMRYRIEDLFGVNPVMLAILTDDNPEFTPQYYEINTWGSTNRTTFHSYKVMNFPPEKYSNPDSPVSIIMKTVYHSIQSQKLTDENKMELYLPIVRTFFRKGFSKEKINLLLSFIENHVNFANKENHIIFEDKIDKMTKYETTQDILDYFDPAKRLEKAEAAFAKMAKAKEKERQAKEKERQAKEKSILLMLNNGFDADLIAESLGISKAEIMSIFNKNKN